MKKSRNILFLGAKPIGYATLKHLIDFRDSYEINIVGVLSNENSAIKSTFSVADLAKKENIPYYENLDDILTIDNIDLLISVQYNKILREKHIYMAKNIAINLHMAPLPEYRGCNQFTFAIINQEKFFGATIHRIDSGIDSGDIIFEKRFKIPENIYVDELYQLTYEASVHLFEQNIGNIISGNFTSTPQKSLLNHRNTKLYFRKDILGLKQIDLKMDTNQIYRTIRATSMPGFEPVFFTIEGEKFYIIPEKNFKN